MKKELLISAKFDTSDFDKSVERMQNRLKDLYAPSDMVRQQSQNNQRMAGMGMGDIRPGVSQEQYQKTALQTKRQLDTFIKEEVKDQEKLTKMIVSREAKVKQLQESQKLAVKNSKEELEIKSKIARVEENSFRLKEYYLQRESTISQALDARTKVAPRDLAGLMESFKGGGFRHGMSQIPGAFRQNPIGMTGNVLGGFGSALTAGSEMYRDWKGMPVRTEGAMGNAVQGTAGRDVSNIYGRRTAFEQNFQPERQRAAQMAIEKNSAERAADKMSLVGNLAKIGGGGMMAYQGAGIGAAAGSAIPGAGTLAGGLVGALPGLGIAGKGLWNMMGDERQRSLMMSPFSKTAGNRYESMMGEQMSNDYQSTLEAQKKQNPFKTQAVGEYEQNWQRNLSGQRQMGLSDQGMYGAGGFMRKNIEQDFTPEMGFEMAGQIQGAGGSTRMQRESAFGNQLSRNADLTNAGQVLGTISGGVGGAEASEQATVKILAEGMKLGLDDSKFAEENRRFTQAAAEVISRSGAGGASDFQRNAQNFSSFMGENTTKGIDAAKSAYEQYQSISSSTTGPRGVMRAAGFMRDEKLSKLSTIQKQALMQLPEEQLNENNPLVAGLAESIGTSGQDLIGRVRGVNQGSVSRFKEADQLRDKLRAKGVDVGKSGDPDYMKTLSSQDRIDVANLMSFQTTELGNQGQREMISRAAGTVGRPEQMGPGVGDEAINAKINGGAAGTGRMGDNTVAAMAGDASTALKNFNEMRGGMDQAAKSAAAFTDQVRMLNAELQRALENKDTGGANDVLKKLMQATGNSTQVQSGKQGK
jgi:hypothetical protein